MNLRYPYLDPDWIPIMKEWVQPHPYDPKQTSESLARDLAYTSGKLDMLAKLENILRLQEREKNAK